MPRVLVTGAQGFLGRSLVAAFLSEGYEAVAGVGRSPRNDDVFTHTLEWCGARTSAPVPAALRPPGARYDYASVDVRDADAVAQAVATFRPDVVVHAAASLRGEDFESLVDANIRSAYGLLAGFDGRVVLVSSGSVYGGARGRLP